MSVSFSIPPEMRNDRFGISVNDVGGADNVRGIYADPFSEAKWNINPVDEFNVSVTDRKTGSMKMCRITSGCHDKAEDVTFQAHGLSIPFSWKLHNVDIPPAMKVVVEVLRRKLENDIELPDNPDCHGRMRRRIAPVPTNEERAHDEWLKSDDLSLPGRLYRWAWKQVKGDDAKEELVDRMTQEKEECFGMLQLPIVKGGGVEASFCEYFADEILCETEDFGDNRMMCEDGVPRDAMVELRIDELPDVMVVEPFRFDFRDEKVDCSPFHVPRVLDMNSPGLDAVFDPDVDRTKKKAYVLAGTVVGTYDPTIDFTVWHARIRLPDTDAWKRCDSTEELNKIDDNAAHTHKIMSTAQAMGLRKTKDGNEMVMRAVYVEASMARRSSLIA